MRQGTRGIDKEIETSDFPAKILLATDGSEDAVRATRAAISLARDTAAELHVVHVGELHYVYPPRTPAPLPPPRRRRRSEGASSVSRQRGEADRAGGGKRHQVLPADRQAGRGDPPLQRGDNRRDNSGGNQGIGQKFSRIRRFLMGSTSEKVTRYARCSVMVVR